MNALAAKTSPSDDAPSGATEAGRAAFAAAHSPEELAAAHINPKTYLATDYLNHFNEAIMLLEMVPDLPDCAEDFLSWRPLSYSEHFTASNFKARDLAIEAYEAADPAVRRQFDGLANYMTSILTAVAAGMRQVQQDHSRAQLAEEATRWVKPLVMIAAGVINGDGKEADVDQIMTQ